MKNSKLKIKNYRIGNFAFCPGFAEDSRFDRSILHFALLSFFILHFTFLIQPAQAAEIVTFKVGPGCFRQEECKSPPFNGTPHSDQLCRVEIPTVHTKEAIERGYTYACWAPQPNVKLQVSIGGYEVTGIENYVRRLFVYLVGISGVVAGIMLVWAGFKWLTSSGSPERITDAKKKIGNAAIGLVLVLSSYLLLQTINPALVQLRLPPVKMARIVQEIKNNPCRSSATKFPCGGFPGAEISDVSTWPGYTSATGVYECNPTKYGGENPCDQPITECWGSYCAGGQGGCVGLDFARDASEGMLQAELDAVLRREMGTSVERFLQYKSQTEPRGCFKKAACANCDQVSITYDASAGILTEEGVRNALLCISSVCNCITVARDLVIFDGGTRQEVERVVCTKRKGANQDCSDDAECDGAAGLVCVPGGLATFFSGGGTIPNPVPFIGGGTRPGPEGQCFTPQSDGLACSEDSDCANGICGVVHATQTSWQCTGGKGTDCGPDNRCAGNLICVDTTGGGGTCSDKTLGSPCRRPSHCLSGHCDEENSWTGQTLLFVGKCIP